MTPRRSAVSDVQLGGVLEALKRGEDDRAEMRETMSEISRAMVELKTTFTRVEVLFEASQVRIVASEITATEFRSLVTRVGDLAARAQSTESFLNVTKTWSLRAVIAVLAGLAFGSAVISKGFDWFAKLFMH